MPRPGPSDTVPALLTPGEAVLVPEVAEAVGRENIKAANDHAVAKRKGIVPLEGYACGASKVQGFATGTEEVAGQYPNPLSAQTTAPASGGVPQYNNALAASNTSREAAAQGTLDQIAQKNARQSASAPMTTAATGGKQIFRSGNSFSDKPNMVNQSTGLTTVGGGTNGQSTANKFTNIAPPMVGMPGVSAGPANNDLAKQNLFARTKLDTAARLGKSGNMEAATGIMQDLNKAKPMTGSPLSQGAENRVSALESTFNKPNPTITTDMNIDTSETDFTALSDKYGVQGYSVGEEEVKPAIEGEYVPADKPAAPKAETKTFDPAKNAAIEGNLPAKSGIIPPKWESPEYKSSYRPNFQTVGDKFVKSQSKALVPAEVAPRISGVRAVTPEVEGVVGRTLSAGKTALKSIPRAAVGNAVAVLPETVSTVRDVAGDELSAQDKALRVTEGATRAGMSLAGMQGGAALGAMTGPFAPVGVPVGGLAGAVLGAYSPEIVRKIASRFGKEGGEFPSEKASRIRQENAATEGAQKAAASEEQYLPAGAPLKNGATVGKEFPEIAFDNPSLRTSVGQKPEAQSAQSQTDFSAKDVGNGMYQVDLTGKGDTWGSKNKAAMERVAAGLKQRGGIFAPPPKQSAAATAAGTTDFWYNQGYPGGAAQYKAEKEQKALENMALNGGGTGDMTVTEYRRANAQQKAAQGILADRERATLQREHLATEGKKADATMAATGAEREYQRQKDLREEARKKSEYDQKERLASSRTGDYTLPGGEIFKGTAKEYAEAKQNKLVDIAAQAAYPEYGTVDADPIETEKARMSALMSIDPRRAYVEYMSANHSDELKNKFDKAFRAKHGEPHA